MVEICSIGSLLERKRTKAKDKYHNVPVYAVTNNRGFVLSSSLHDFDIFSDDTSNYMVVSKNDFAYNPSRLNVGSIAYFKEEGNGLISPMYVVFHADENKILAEYLYIVIKSEFVRNKIDALKEVGARFRFDFNRWGLIKIPIPSLEEQTRIVGILDTFTSAIDNLKKQIAQRRKQYEYYRDQLLDLEGKPGVEMKTLGEVCEISGDYGLSAPSKPYDGVRYLRITDITDSGGLNNEYVSADLKEDVVKEPLVDGDILFARTGATVGKTLVYRSNFGKCLFAGYLIRYRARKQVVFPQYLLHFTHSTKYYNWVSASLAVGAQPNISAQRYNQLQFPLPPLSEQQRIVSILDTFEASINNLEQQLAQREKQYEYYRNKLLTFE